MIKAEGAGSTPAGVTSNRKDPSEPLRRLLKDIGEAVAALNTAVVGLDAVENGHRKPKALNVNWAPKDPRVAARKSRKFILESVLVRVAEAINQFVKGCSKLPRFGDLHKDFEKKSNAKKVSILATRVLGPDDYLTPGVVLLIHWRNRAVHHGSPAKLNRQEEQLLRKHESVIAERYARLDVDQLLQHFHDKSPTLKDISSLISMTINLARKIDRTMAIELDKSELDAWIEWCGLNPMIEKVERETSPKKQQESIHRLFMSEAPRLLDAYKRHYGSSNP